MGAGDHSTESREVVRLRSTVAALRERVADLERLADTDTLTPLPNRRAFVREVARAIVRHARRATPAAVMFVDVDGLKAINDAWGHAGGDAALRHVATILRAEVRASDSVARIGGDEFALLLEGLDAAGARAKAGALRAALDAHPLAWDGTTIRIGLSPGVATIAPDDTPDGVIARADAAMYAAKSAQRSDR